MCRAQIGDGDVDEVINDNRITTDCAERTERNAGAFSIGLQEVSEIGRNRQNVTCLIFTEEQRMGQAAAVLEADIQSLARGHGHFSQRQSETARRNVVAAVT